MIETAIKEKGECTGCHSCANICIRKCIAMIPDQEGFLYPKTEYGQCIHCGKCIDSCPVINKSVGDNESIAFACISRDEKIRRESSSGGIFSLIAEQVLEDGGIVFGVGFNAEYVVEHSSINTKRDLGRFRGSKYVQSRIGYTYNQVKSFLDEGCNVVFVGTPCQIGGLKSFLSRPYENLISIDIVCHGVPSPAVWRKYLEYQEKKNGAAVENISFRDKKYGWKLFGVSMLFKNGSEYYKTLYKDLFMRAFLKDICLRPSCYDCKFKTLHRQSDITLADFWGIQNLLPDMDDDKGTSLVFINTDAGQSMLDKISDKIICMKVDIHQAVQHNPAAIKSATFNPRRDSFFAELDSKAFDKLVSKYCIDKTYIRVLRIAKRISNRLINMVRKETARKQAVDVEK